MEDMMWMYVMNQPAKWEDYLHLIDFAYNNSYHELLKMSPYEVLYGRKCRTPTNWNGLKEKILMGLDMLREMEQEVKKIC